MALRLALVIDGDASGAKQALEETAGGIDAIGKAADKARAPLSGMGGDAEKAGERARKAGGGFEFLSEEETKARIGLQDTHREAGRAAAGLADIEKAAPAAAGGLAQVTKATDTASGSIGSLGTILVGAAGGLAASLAITAVGEGLKFAAEHAGTLFAEIVSNEPMIVRALTAHADLVGRIKSRWAEAAGAASSYGVESVAQLRFESQQNVNRLEGALAAGLNDLQTGILHPAVDAGGSRAGLGPLRDSILAFRAELREGNADVIAFRRSISEIAEDLPSDAPLRTTTERLLERTKAAAEMQGELARSRDLLQALEGDAEAAATALGGSAEKYGALSDMAAAAAPPIGETTKAIRDSGDAAATAVPALAEYDRLMRSIGSMPAADASPVRGALTPLTAGRAFASGGVVGKPTLFAYGAGEIGLMGEAGEEAILPLAGGAVRASLPGGGETTLPLARMADGDLGVSLDQGGATGFASGGAFGGAAASGGFAETSSLSNVLSVLRGSLSGFGQELVRTKDFMSALGGVAERLNQRFMDMALNALDAAVFGSGSGNTGLLGLLAGSLFGASGARPGFSEGGFTGWGNPRRVAGDVHEEEYVISAPAVRAIGVGNLERMHRTAKSGRGFAEGGYTGGGMAMGGGGGMGGGVQRIVLEINEGPMFRTTMREEGRAEAVEVVTRAAPAIVSASSARTLKGIGNGDADKIMAGRYGARPQASRKT